MTFEELQQLVAGDESVQLELKKSTGELKDGMHTACAFLNGAGGWLVFGVTPKSLKILGQEVTDNTQQEIAQALSGLEPAVIVDIQYVDVPDRSGCKVIAMYFEAFVWGSTPYTYHGSPYYKIIRWRAPRRLCPDTCSRSDCAQTSRTTMLGNGRLLTTLQ